MLVIAAVFPAHTGAQQPVDATEPAAGALIEPSSASVPPEPLSPDPQPLSFRVVVDAPKPYASMLEEGLDLVRWQRDTRVTLPVLERLVAEARKATAEALAAEGYFAADVQSRIENTDSKQAVVRIIVNPGTRSVVRDVDLQFQGPVLDDVEGRKRIDVVRQTWRLPPGAPFRQAQWGTAKTEALLALGRGRYAAARITDSEARVDPEQHRADLALKFDSGPIFHAGPTVVNGLRRYPPSIVENVNPMRPGEPYDALKLDLFQRQLLETGYFNAVNFAIDPDPAHAAAAPLRVDVIEAPSQRIDTGIAFSTDTRLGLSVDYGNANIFDNAWRFRSRLNLNAKEQTLNTSFDSPPRPGGVWDTYSTRLERRDIEGEITREAVVGYAHNWGLERTPSRVSLAAHAERQMIAGSTTENNYAVFAAYRKTFRTTDDIVSPRRGVLGTFEVGASVPGLNTRDFARMRAHVNWLIPLGLRNDFLIRSEAGLVLAGSRFGIPSSFLFRTGGDQTVRGYAFESIGVPQGEAIVGGRYLATASAEYTRWISESLGAAVFVDAGDAFDRVQAFDVAVGYGIGVRWRSPVGPLRADLAYGERTKSVRLHFSVGYSF
ncbi:MAG TPA: autotransporter assembly complex family protein [Burkholderiales bacterium]|nr:autotransporter assembly complex family protein [Burkholderiales bacterium]